MKKINSVLIVGATGSIGRFAVEEAAKTGLDVRALMRESSHAEFGGLVELIRGDLTQSLTLEAVDAVVFTQGSYETQMAEFVDYNGVRNVLNALKGNLKRIALMTSIYATEDRENSHWKRRAERLVRASGVPYTIIRPSWFDTNLADELTLTLSQNNRGGKYKFTAQDGGVSRRQIGEILVRSLQIDSAINRTVELFSVKGRRTTNFDALFANTLPDNNQNDFDGLNDPHNLPFDQEPENVRQDLMAITKI